MKLDLTASAQYEVSALSEAKALVQRVERLRGGGVAAEVVDEEGEVVAAYDSDWGEWRLTDSPPDAKVTLVQIFTDPLGGRPILALTLWQPWAFAIAHLGKRVENRTWPAPPSVVGQRIAIHAGVRVDRAAFSSLAAEFSCNLVALPRKAVVATATVVSVVSQKEHLAPNQRRWFVGPYGWVLDDVRVLATPVPCRGYQRLWRLPPDVAAQVK